MSEAFFTQFTGWYGRPFPEDYLVFDCETTGIDRKQDLPWQIGHCVVRGRQVVNRGVFVLDWTDWPGVDEDWLRDRIERVGYHMRKKSKNWDLTWEHLKTKGEPPEKVLSFYHKLFQTNREAGAAFVAHNGWFFDAILLSQCFEESCGIDFQFLGDEIFDTGCFEKAILGELYPTKEDRTLKDYSLRVHAKRLKGIRWNIEDCIKRYGIQDFPGVDLNRLHGDASEDCLVTHVLFERQRAFVERCLGLV